MILALLSRILISERVIGNDRLMLFEMQGFFSLYLEKYMTVGLNHLQHGYLSLFLSVFIFEKEQYAT